MPAAVVHGRGTAWAGVVALLTALTGPVAGGAEDAGNRVRPVHASAHFRLRTVGDWRSERLEREALMALERWYRRYMIAFELEPPLPIKVRLYPDRLFHASTGAPPWADGAYGRGEGIQVASGGVARLQADMERVLAHELAHAFITERSSGRAPRWLQEGLAQALAPRGTYAPPAGGPPAAERPDDLDYPGWHAFTGALIHTHGVTSLIDVLADLGRGLDLDTALRNRVGATGDELYRAWAWSRGMSQPAPAAVNALPSAAAPCSTVPADPCPVETGP